MPKLETPSFSEPTTSSERVFWVMYEDVLTDADGESVDVEVELQLKVAEGGADGGVLEVSWVFRLHCICILLNNKVYLLLPQRNKNSHSWL